MLGVVVVYFNPVDDFMRRVNTLNFLAYLSQFTNISVSFVEAIDTLEPLVRERCSANMVSCTRVRCSSVIWRKEALINIGVKALPPSIDKIAWLDSDVCFDDPAWPEITGAMLDKEADIIQMFSSVDIMGPHNKFVKTQECGCVEASFMGATPLPGKIVAGHTGFAWAMRRSAFDSMSGLHEFSIVGGGDMDLVCALFGCPEKIRIDKSPKQWDMYLQWAMKVFSQKLSVNRLQIPIRHFWHGDESNRQYETRAQILVSQDYDPVQDVTHTSQGSIELSVKGARLQATIFQYFAARKTYL